MATPDITIYGAGIFGLSIGFEILKRGFKVKIVDISKPGFGASGGLLGALAIHDSHSVSLKLRCGKGGYVRSIARDLGIELGCFAHVRTLKRIASGPFKIENAITFDIFKNRTISYSSSSL